MSFIVRPGRGDDLPAIQAIWYADEVAADSEPPASGPILSSFRYELEHGVMRVAEDASGRTLGFGATVGWDNPAGLLTYLADLFIAEDTQSQGVGQALLRALPLGEDVPRCVHASVDPRATALYIRWGMEPRWPNYLLAADPEWGARGLATLPGADLEVVEAAPNDPELAAWDLRHFGYPRARDLAWLMERRDALPLWFRRAGQTLGYGYIQRHCDESLWNPNAWTVGPLGAEEPADARECVCAAVRWAVAQGGAARLAVPGPHPALAPLIAAGCRIVYTETFLASASARFFDPTRYLPSGVFL